eukprot:CAMPEP_0116156676 /NCGR_PEP_ID=MMETSP0329-20121206/22955_1 /TAXON_ID=697910 /ORGANISM="Pseudo-nitzschia arenysensis, Strain B593" /LENGTH=646 /DNA_ID=CAMNT_0003653767 /DNA_START=254 /DNA_END=2194 /DNA_ORIENTATION=-
MKTLLLEFVVLHLLAVSTSASRLRGSGNKSQIERATKQNNNEERNDVRNLQTSDAPSEDIPLFIDGAIFVTESPTVPPTLRPTAFPTWTFKVEEAQLEVEEAKEPFVCEYCSQGCYFGTAVVDFGRGAKVTCNRIMNIAPALTHFQCEVDRDLIENTCCCNSAAKADSRIEPDVVIELPAEIPEPEEEAGPCDFCSNGDFLSNPIIRFKRGDSVSCRGFKDLLDLGTMPDQFCRMERDAIEEACCQPNEYTKPITVSRTPPESRVENVGNDSSTVVEGDDDDDSSTSVTPKEEKGDNEEEDNGSCSICEGKKFLNSPTINFSSGDSVSCAGLKSLLGMGLPPMFCKNERATIEATCCPQRDFTQPITAFQPPSIDSPDETPVVENGADEILIEQSAVEQSAVDESDGGDDISSVSASPSINNDPCSFCVGQKFLTRPIINFSTANDSVSCGGLKELVHMGLPSMFCKAERAVIEESCCETLSSADFISRPIVNTNSVAATQLLDSPTAEPTSKPTSEPTIAPTAEPTNEPTDEPTATQTVAPTAEPTANPTTTPTAEPTTEPTSKPTSKPTEGPTTKPTIEPTSLPTETIVESETKPVSDSIPVSLTESPSQDNMFVETEASTETIIGRGGNLEEDVESKENGRRG